MAATPPVHPIMQMLMREAKQPVIQAASPTPMPSPATQSVQNQDARLSAAVDEAKKKYPWIARMKVPIKLTIGKGPYMSESYEPTDEDNPHPGNFTVELRHPRYVNDTSTWAAVLGREGMDYMARADPTFQNYANSFRGMMTPPQLARAYARYQREMPNGYNDKGQSEQDFQDFLKGAEVQEYLGGYVFNMGHWRETGGYTPQQTQLLDRLSKYMWGNQPPQWLNIP